MWSIRTNCLHPLNTLNVEKTYETVKNRWVKILRYCLLLTFFLFSVFDSVHASSPVDHVADLVDVTTKTTHILETDEASILPIYMNDSLRLNITWKNLKWIRVGVLNISASRNGSLKKCQSSSEHYKIPNINASHIIIPETILPNTFLLSNCTYRIAISPSPIRGKNKLELNFTLPGTSAAENITPFPFYDEDNDEVKLNVSWKNPTEPLLPISYHVKISPNEENPDHCKDHSQMDEKYVSAEATSVVLHQKIIPNCTYTIEIEAQPANDGYKPRIIYTVPECVDEHCWCRYLRSRPPTLNVKQISTNIIEIYWKIPISTLANLSNIKFRISLAQLNNIIPIFHTRNITDRDIGIEMRDQLTVPEMKIGALYEIKAWYINSNRCESSPARLNYHAQSPEDSTHAFFLVPIIILMIISLPYLAWRKRILFHSLSQWIGCHQTTGRPSVIRIHGYRRDGSGERFQSDVPMQYNVIYRKSDSEEAQERQKADHYEISYSCLEFEKNIGKGAFGLVFRARARGIPGITGYTTVAVKKIDENATPDEKEEFRLEIEMLKHIGRHPNIVTLLGCCTRREPFFMIMEYLPFGDLLRYLQTLRLQCEKKRKLSPFTINRSFDSCQHLHPYKQKISDASYVTPRGIPSSRLPSETETEYTLLGSDTDEPVTPEPIAHQNHDSLECALDPRELQHFALQIARGMEHLENKQIVHRDLAARNILIDDNKILKISDFGLSRIGIYTNSKQKKLPLRWLSVEAIRDNRYTSKSDVWAFGIVLWEIGTLGGFPYPTIADCQILPYLMAGNRLERPENSSNELYNLMRKCWSHSEDQRPSFSQLVQYLETNPNRPPVYIDFSQHNPLYIFPPMERKMIS